MINVSSCGGRETWYGVLACFFDDDPDDGASFSIGKAICEGFEGDGDQANGSPSK